MLPWSVRPLRVMAWARIVGTLNGMFTFCDTALQCLIETNAFGFARGVLLFVTVAVFMWVGVFVWGERKRRQAGTPETAEGGVAEQRSLPFWLRTGPYLPWIIGGAAIGWVVWSFTREVFRATAGPADWVTDSAIWAILLACWAGYAAFIYAARTIARRTVRRLATTESSRAFWAGVTAVSLVAIAAGVVWLSQPVYIGIPLDCATC